MRIKETIQAFSDEMLITLVRDYDFLEEEGWLGEAATLRDVVKEIKEDMGDNQPNFIIMAHSIVAIALRELVRRSYKI